MDNSVAIPLLGVYPKEPLRGRGVRIRAHGRRDETQQPERPQTEERITKRRERRVMRYYGAWNRKGVPRTNLEGVSLSEISRTRKGRHRAVPLV